MSRVRTAVLISGRGSNMEALIRAAADPACPFEIALVLANREDAPGLDTAARAGIPAEAIAHQPFGKDREAHERVLDTRLRNAGIELVALAGLREVYGLNAKIEGPLDKKKSAKPKRRKS